MIQLELTADEAGVLREALVLYLNDFRREVAGTENPEFRGTLAHRQVLLEKLVDRLQGAPTQAA
jgi:hypothetical protein